MRGLWLFLMTVASASAAQASTVVVTFDAVEGSYTAGSYAANELAYSGTWREAGFLVDYAIDAVYSPPSQPVSYLNDSPAVYDTPCCDDVGRFLEFRRADGSSFSLLSLSILGTLSSWIGEIGFVPALADGSLDYARSVSRTVIVAYENIALSGFRTDGTRTQVLLSSFEYGALVSQSGDLFGRPTHVDLTDPQKEMLSDLASLRVDMYTGSIPFADIVRRSQAISSVDPVLVALFDACLASGPDWPGSCDLPGIGQLTFMADSNNYWNFGSGAAVDNFQFDVSHSGMAPVPLPASWVLCAAGLGALRSARFFTARSRSVAT